MLNKAADHTKQEFLISIFKLNLFLLTFFTLFHRIKQKFQMDKSSKEWSHSEQNNGEEMPVVV